MFHVEMIPKEDNSHDGYKELAAAVLELATREAVMKERRGKTSSAFYTNWCIHTARRLLLTDEPDYTQYRDYLLERVGLNPDELNLWSCLERMNKRGVPLRRWNKYPKNYQIRERKAENE